MIKLQLKNTKPITMTVNEILSGECGYFFVGSVAFGPNTLFYVSNKAIVALDDKGYAIGAAWAKSDCKDIEFHIVRFCNVEVKEL